MIHRVFFSNDPYDFKILWLAATFRFLLIVVRIQWTLETSYCEDSLGNAQRNSFIQRRHLNDTIFNFHNWKPKSAVSIKLNQVILRGILDQFIHILNA